MKAKLIFSLPIVALLLLLGGCSDKDDDTPKNTQSDTEYINTWMYNKMKSLYLWNDKLPASPDYTKSPKDFYQSILYNYGMTTGDRFSTIEEDETKSTKTLFGGGNLGFDYLPYSYFPDVNTTSSLIGLLVISVDKGTDAEAKGLKRGQIIYGVNGANVTYENYLTILDKSSLTLSVYNKSGEKETLPVIQASAVESSPIFMSKVISTSGKKIGYLMYNAFDRNANDEENNYEYDIKLIESIADLKAQGVTEFVLDLRYNLGGYLTSAMDLASALVPNRNIKNIFAIEEYNDHFQDSIVTRYGADALNEYFLDKVYGTSVEIPKLNLSRLYVITGNYTASASELVINGLKPYMTIYQIGETTVGKDKASMPVQEKNNSRIPWILHPIISRLTNADGGGNYINGIEPDSEIFEMFEGYEMVSAVYRDDDGKEIRQYLPVLSPWKGGLGELGDPSEPLLAEAIAHITGVPRTKSVKSITPLDNKVRQVPYIKQNRDRYRMIIDQNKFDNLTNAKQK
ncbi:MAG: hypothetical protein LBV71_13060 [Prevotella sp.]|nr:hypothetical protein [Prevotella sp.]